MPRTGGGGQLRRIKRRALIGSSLLSRAMQIDLPLLARLSGIEREILSLVRIKKALVLFICFSLPMSYRHLCN